MNDKLKGVLITTGVVASLGVGGAAIAGATSGGGERDDDATDKPIAGDARSQAVSAALKHTGGGKATETESATRRAPTRSRSPGPTEAKSTST